MTPHRFAVIVWGAWLVSWLAASAWSERAVKRPTASSEVVYRVVTAVGCVLLFGFYEPAGSPLVFWRANGPAGWGLAGVVVLGVAFAWWARVHIGRLWSSGVTRKADHHVVDTGPYRIVRHPIYSGMLLSAYATAGLRATVFTITGAAVVTVGFYIKARLEERFLRAELGPAYDAYARRVGMLVPFT